MAQQRLKQRDFAGLRDILNAWDPIGVAEWEVDDEYDCLLAPIVGKLVHGASARDLRKFIDAELSGHFGLGGRVPPRVVDEIVAWWAQRS